MDEHVIYLSMSEQITYTDCMVHTHIIYLSMNEHEVDTQVTMSEQNNIHILCFECAHRLSI